MFYIFTYFKCFTHFTYLHIYMFYIFTYFKYFTYLHMLRILSSFFCQIRIFQTNSSTIHTISSRRWCPFHISVHGLTNVRSVDGGCKSWTSSLRGLLQPTLIPPFWIQTFGHFLTFLFTQRLCTVRTMRDNTHTDACTHVWCFTQYSFLLHFQVKGKSVPLQTRRFPDGSRKLRFPDLATTAHGGGKCVSLTHWPPLPPGNTPCTHFC